MLLRGHARPGQALLPRTIYPLSAASVRVQHSRTCESVMRQPQLSSHHRAWETQWPPVNRFSGGSCSFFKIFLLFSFFFFFSLDCLSKPMLYLVIVCLWYFEVLQKEMGFTGSSSCRFDDTDFTPKIYTSLHKSIALSLLFSGGNAG